MILIKNNEIENPKINLPTVNSKRYLNIKFDKNILTLYITLITNKLFLEMLLKGSIPRTSNSGSGISRAVLAKIFLILNVGIEIKSDE